MAKVEMELWAAKDWRRGLRGALGSAALGVVILVAGSVALIRKPSAHAALILPWMACMGATLILGAVLLLITALRPVRYAGGVLEARADRRFQGVNLLAIAVFALGFFHIALAAEGSGRLAFAAVGVCIAALAIHNVLLIATWPKIELWVTAEGVYQPRRMRAPLPWDRCTGLSLTRIGPSIGVTFLCGGGARLQRRGWLEIAPSRQGVTIWSHGLDCSVADVLLAVEAIRPQLLAEAFTEKV